MELGGGGDGMMRGLKNRGLWPAGFIVGENEGEVVVGLSMPIPNKAQQLEEIKSGDVIVALNGNNVTSVAQLNEIYAAIDVGSEVKVELRREDDTETLTFEKPKAPKMKMVIE